MTDWQAWERDVATRALEALDTGSVAVHDALHSLLECCLQLHPAAARHLYEAAKKDDDMFSPKYSGGHGFGGGMPYGAMPLPGRPAAVPHPATLAGTSAYQQAQVMALMEAGHSGPALPAAPPHALGVQHHQVAFAAQSQGPPFQSYQHPGPLYQPPRHLQHHHHRQAQQQLGPFQQQPQHQGQYPQHWPPLPPGCPPGVSSTMEQLQWEPPYRGAPHQAGADNSADLQQQRWHQPPQHEAPWQPAAGMTRGTAYPAADSPAPAVRRTLSTPPAAGFGDGGPAAQRGGGLHAREQSWDDFSPAQPPPEASLRAPSAPTAAGTRRRAAGGGGATPLQGRPPLQQAGSPRAGEQPAPGGTTAALEQQHPPPAPVSSPLPGAAAMKEWEIREREDSMAPDQQLVPLPGAVLRHATLPEVAQTQGIVPAVVSVPLDVMAPAAHMQQEVQHQQQAAAVVSAPAAPAISLPQRTIDEVDLQQLAFGRQIGEGGFGRVYAGQWRGLPVAVKVVSQAAPLDGQLVAEFRREIATMAALPPHPHVLPLLAACTAPPHLALVTPFCARGSLYGLLHAPGLQLSWRHIVHLALGAARGMAHLHACHILHRDLKSGNLLVEADWTVRVADFGLSRVMADLHTMASGAAPADTGGLGTYEYMAPEVLAHQRYSEKADVYSFGVVLWEMCARAMPYPGLNGMQAALAVMNRGLRPEIPSATPAPLAGLIREAWAPASAQRPSFDAVVQALDGIHGSIASSGSHQ